MEDIIEIVDTISESQKYVLLLLGDDNSKPVKKGVHLQKEMYLISNNIEELKINANFEPHFEGPYSETINEELKYLKMDGLIEEKFGSIQLTDFGKNVVSVLKSNLSNEILTLVHKFKSWANDLTENELLFFIYSTFDMTDESLVIERLMKKRKELAYSLYKKRKISLGKMAELAGISLDAAMNLRNELEV